MDGPIGAPGPAGPKGDGVSYFILFYLGFYVCCYLSWIIVCNYKNKDRNYVCIVLYVNYTTDCLYKRCCSMSQGEKGDVGDPGPRGPYGLPVSTQCLIKKTH